MPQTQLARTKKNTTLSIRDLELSMFHCSYRLAKILFADVARKPQMEDNCFMYWHFKTISRLDILVRKSPNPHYI